MKLRFSDQYHVILGQTIHDDEIIRTNVTMEVRKMEAVVEAVKAHRDDRGWSFSMHRDDMDPQTWSDVIGALADLDAALEEKEKKTNGE